MILELLILAFAFSLSPSALFLPHRSISLCFALISFYFWWDFSQVMQNFLVLFLSGSKPEPDRKIWLSQFVSPALNSNLWMDNLSSQRLEYSKSGSLSLFFVYWGVGEGGRTVIKRRGGAELPKTIVVTASPPFLFSFPYFSLACEC